MFRSWYPNSERSGNMGAMYINRDGYLVWPADYHNARWLVKVNDCGECGEYRGEMFCPNTGETRPR